MSDEILEFLMFWIMKNKIERKMSPLLKIDDLVTYIEKLCEVAASLDEEDEVFEEEFTSEDENFDYDDITEDTLDEMEKESIWDGESLDDPNFIKEKIMEVVDNYQEYFKIYKDSICFNTNLTKEQIDYKIEEIGRYIDKEILEEILEEIENNVDLLKILGFTFYEKDMKQLLENERELQQLYFGGEWGEGVSLMSSEIVGEAREEIVKEIRKKLFMSKVLWANYFAKLKSFFEYSDSYTYLIGIGEDVTYGISSWELNEDEVMELFRNSLLDAMFIQEDNGVDTLMDKLSIGVRLSNNPIFEKKNSHSYRWWDEQKNLFLGVLYFLEEEINKYSDYDEEIRNYLIGVKYRVMEVLDYVFDFSLFSGTLPNEVEGIRPNNSSIVYVMIDDILSYQDLKYDISNNVMTSRVNIINNTLKMIVIKAYYYLSGDEELTQHIKNNPNYKKNKISSDFVDGAITIGKDIKLRKKKID